MAATTLRKGLMALAGMALAVAFVGGMLVLVLNSGSGTEEASAPLPVPTTAVDEEVPATTVAGGTATDSRGEGVEDGYLPSHESPEGVPLPAMGIATSAFNWTTSQLTGSVSGETWINSLVEIDGTLWAIGGGYDEATDTEVSFVYRSTDGVNWESVELPATMSGPGSVMFTATEAGLVATMNAWNEDTSRSQISVVVSTGGESWAETDLASFVGANQSMWINQVAGTADAIILTGTRETVPDVGYEPVTVVIEHDGYRIELSEMDWTYRVIAAATGDVVASGSQEQIWSEVESDFGIYDAAGELVFPMQWDDLDQAGNTAYESAQWGEPLVVTLTKEGRTLGLDEFSGEVTVTDSGGAVLFSGSEETLWQGPPPTFRGSGGEVLVRVPWEVWNDAHAAAYPEATTYIANSDPVLLRSGDGGSTWESVDISAVAPSGFFFQSVVGGPDGFLAFGSLEPIFEDLATSVERHMPPVPTVLKSSDGLVWTEVPTDFAAGSWIHSLVASDDGYLAILSGTEGDSRVVSSADGTTWQTVLNQGSLGLELGQVYFERLATGGLGTFVMGTYDGYMEPEQRVASFSRDGRTLTISGSEYTVTNDATGEVLYTLNEASYAYFEEESTSVPRPGFKWGQGGLTVFDDNGGVVFAISHRQFEETMSAIWNDPGVYYESEPVLLRWEAGSWTRVLLPEDLASHTWFGGMVVTDISVVMTSTSENFTDTAYRVTNSALVGVPAG